MGILHHRNRRHHPTNPPRSLHTLTAAFTFLLFSSVSVTTLARQCSAVVHSQQKSGEKRTSRSTPGVAVKTTLERGLADQKRFNRPGSWPPSCKSKCEWCSPCKPVHVPIQPGLSVPLEYYPEAWRCKCGDKLFMP